MKVTAEKISEFEAYLKDEEKEISTIKQYSRTAAMLAEWLGGGEVSKQALVKYKEHLKEKYKLTSINAALNALNSFFRFCGRSDLKLKLIRLQKNIFSKRDRELSRAEYESLINAAKRRGKTRLMHIVQTIFATGIRVSELKYITVESLKTGIAEIDCKGKHRRVFLSRKLCKRLKKYTNKTGIRSGIIFITRSGKPVDRSNIAKAMKELANDAEIDAKKVFPHNLRHLFARVYYSAYKDIVRLADILGHSSINTTRIYTIESGDIHRQQIEHLRLVI